MIRQLGQQCLRAHHFASQAVTYPDGQFRKRRIAFFQNVEMRIKRRDLISLRHRDAHLFRQGGQMGCRNLIVLILDQMQVFDQQVALSRPIASVFGDLLDRRRDKLTSFVCARPRRFFAGVPASVNSSSPYLPSSQAA